ncbi:MAG: glycosyltransferase family 4 protein [Solirubrobacteraceae bacterium]
MATRSDADTRVLVLCPRYPFPATRGDQRRVLNFVRGLSELCRVRLLTFGEGPPLPVEGVSTVTVARSPAATVSENLRTRDPRLPLQVRLYLDAAMRRAVAAEMQRFRPHVVHATLSRMAPYLPAAGPVHRHLDLVDPASVNMRSRARSMSGPARLPFALEARLAASYEARAAARADTVSLVSEVDRGLVPQLGRAAVIPIGVEESSFPFRAPIDRPPTLIFFGNLGYFHNLEPARFAACEVLPRLRRDLPDASLALVGARPAPAVVRLGEREGVTVVGPVNRMVEHLHRAAVALLPIFSGSGMQNKILEAFSAGTPVVTTPAAIAPVAGARPGEHCLVAQTPAEMADACRRLVQDSELAGRLAGEARALVQERYGIEGQARALLDLYGRAAAPVYAHA